MIRTAWARFRSLPLIVQIVAGFVALSLALAPFASTETTPVGEQRALGDVGGSTNAPSSPPSEVASELVDVPDLTGLSNEEAQETLSGLGLELVVEEEFSAEDPGSVIGQRPSAGSISPGGVVMVTVAVSFPRVPDVTGLKLARARSELSEAGFEVKVTKQVSSQPAGTVIRQSPSDGTTAKPGRIIKLVVAKEQRASPNCDPSYPGVCISPYPPDLDCGEVPYTNFAVVGSDPHGFDGDNDGVGCET